MLTPEQKAELYAVAVLRVLGVSSTAEGYGTALIAVRALIEECAAAYGADCAAQERERCKAIIRASEHELWAAGTNQSFIDGYKAALSGVFAALT